MPRRKRTHAFQRVAVRSCRVMSEPIVCTTKKSVRGEAKWPSGQVARPQATRPPGACDLSSNTPHWWPKITLGVGCEHPQGRAVGCGGGLGGSHNLGQPSWLYKHRSNRLGSSYNLRPDLLVVKAPKIQVERQRGNLWIPPDRWEARVGCVHRTSEPRVRGFALCVVLRCGLHALVST
ncbi:unnamed protein product [Ectocarpus sp. 8 AP-2014]